MYIYIYIHTYIVCMYVCMHVCMYAHFWARCQLHCHSYFMVSKKICSQIIDIHMGSDPAPFFANLFYAIMRTNE